MPEDIDDTEEDVKIASIVIGAVTVIGLVRSHPDELMKPKKQGDYSKALDLRRLDPSVLERGRSRSNAVIERVPKPGLGHSSLIKRDSTSGKFLPDEQVSSKGEQARSGKDKQQAG